MLLVPLVWAETASVAIHSLAGVRVLLVEDQGIIALQIEDVLRKAGCEVVGPVARMQAAISLAHDAALDAAVLDINLDGENTYPVAEELQRRNIPFVLATGYGDSAVPERWKSLPRLSKPFLDEQLERLIRRLCC